MEKLFKIMDSNVGSALGWTLVHSLWQIIAISLIYAILLRLEKRSEIRYWAGISFIFIQFIVSLITAFVVFQPESIFQTSAATKQYFLVILKQINGDSQVSVFQKVLLFLDSNLYNFVIFWLLGIFILLIRLVFNYIFVNRLKTEGLSNVNESIKYVLSGILNKVQLKKAVRIYESSKISIPVVIGFIKPMILLPVGLATNLSQKQIEAILAHEIAHIKRNDFIINILQSFVEVLFFYHPAFWWMSSKIRTERENCCDDEAIEIIGEKIHLIKALANVESYRQNPVLAMAFGRKKFTLLERIHRILGIKTTTNRNHESLIFVTVLVGIMAGHFIFQSNNASAQTQKINSSKISPNTNNASKLVINNLVIQNDTLTNERGVMQFFNGKTSVFVTKDGEIYINKKKQVLSEDEKVQVKKHIDEIVRLEKKMKPYEQEIEKLSHEMDKFSSQMTNPSKEMEIHTKNLETQTKKIQTYAQQQEKLVKQMARLQEDSKEYKELSKQLEASEIELDKLEKEMSVFEREMDKVGSEMEKNHLPMDSIGNLMQKFEKPMEEIGQEMEVHTKAIMKILPYNIRKDIENGMSFTPPPPPPPLPVRSVKVARPARPASVSKMPPPPPPFPIEKAKKPTKVKSPQPNE